MQANPTGTDGFDFLEFTTQQPLQLIQHFESLGFIPVAKHASQSVIIYQQNNTRFILNTAEESMSKQFADLHGPSVCAMGFRVNDAKIAYQYALAKGATPYQPHPAEDIYHIPAIYGVGNSLIYFVDYKFDTPNYAPHFRSLSAPPHQGMGLMCIDHVTHNLYRGNMTEWADFYERIFNFKEIRYFDIEGRVTGLKSKALASPCGKIRIPLNESADDQSQIEEFLKDFNGEGIQHIALATDNIYESVTALRKKGITFLDTPDTYYEMIEKRLPNHGEPIDDLKKNRILIDGNTNAEKKLLLQIFTKNMLGPVFFEIIQRKGDQGFGEGNFQALFESIELDQIKRGVVKV